MDLFPIGHATHPHWEMAADLVLAQLRACMRAGVFAARPSLGLVYITDHFAENAQAHLWIWRFICLRSLGDCVRAPGYLLDIADFMTV